MIDEFERGEQGTSTYFNIVEKKFGITTVTNLKAEGTHEKTAKRLKTDDIQEKKRSIFQETPDDRVERCNTEKSKHYQRKNFRTAGTFFGMKPCGIILFVYELFISESKSQVYGILHDVLSKWGLEKIDRICYDDACHLKKYCMNPKRKCLTAVAERLANMDMVIDKMHFRNHVDNWCKTNCNPYDRKDLDGVDTEVCEQTFSWLSQYGKITRHMNQNRFIFYIVNLCELRNRRVERTHNNQKKY
ncbi:uncharacterized protein LOC122952504 [Acropora millepora]|uniref:uncharacterized protein LOC122952504 n=1 Tax=Acropora millepora TaxID=45264 RepID=UPI001CF57114|nr:uncharacterized protein LOC122952504 [Acropora millepora]